MFTLCFACEFKNFEGSLLAASSAVSGFESQRVAR